MQYKADISSYSANSCRQRTLQCSLFLVAIFATLIMPDMAYAGDPLSATICIVVNWFTGPLGRAIATLGILVLGVGALMGKVSWGAAITVAVGLSIMFGGAQLVDILVQGTPVTASAVCAGVTGGPAPGYISEVLCKLAALASSPTGRAFSTLAVALIGVSCLMGKMSAGAGLVSVLGVGIFHGADTIGQRLVGMLSGGPTWAASPGCVPSIM